MDRTFDSTSSPNRNLTRSGSNFYSRPGTSASSNRILAAASRGLPPKDGNDGDPDANEKVWVQLYGPNGEEGQVRVTKGINITELRKAVKMRTGLPVKALELTFNNKVLAVGMERPFLHHDEAELVVHWAKMDRLKGMLAHRSLKDINSFGQFDRTILHFAVIDGDPDLCKEIVGRKDFDFGLINFQDVFRDTPLMLAAILGYTEIAEMLVDRQANLESQNLGGRTALQLAAEHGHHAVCKALLQENAQSGPAPACSGIMGFTTSGVFPSTPYLAELNDRPAVQHRIKLHNLSRKAGNALGF